MKEAEMRAGWLCMLLALTVTLALGPAVALAQTGEVTATGEVPPFDVVAGTDSWLGGLAAVGCGIMVRATIVTGGTQVATYVGAVACCGYLLFDLLVVDPH
jgi:hypothetical protein